MKGVFLIFDKSKKAIGILILLFVIFACNIVKADEINKTSIVSNVPANSVSKHTDNIHGKVIKVSSPSNTESNEIYNNIQVEVLSGKFKGKTITIQNYLGKQSSDQKNNIQNVIRSGDEVLISIEEDASGGIVNSYIYDMVRYKYIYILTFVFVILIVLVGGIKGLKSIITLAITGGAVMKFFVPMVLKGYNPITVSIAVCIVVIIVNLFILSGRSEKTLASIIGTTGGVLVAGLIAIFSNYILRVNGLTDDEIQVVIYTTKNMNFNFTGLLFAGIIMGALGAVMDVSMSIASAIKEIKEVRPNITRKELIKCGMNVGKDIMGTMANTLILAYAGGAMYVILMMVSYTTVISEIINQDIVAAEILKALAGSIGLIVTIPITAVVAAILMTRQSKTTITKKSEQSDLN